MKEASQSDHVFVVQMDLGGKGLRVGIKDSIDIAGYPTRQGSPCLAAIPAAERHAEVVRLILEAGGRIVGKTSMHELAYGITGINRWSGTPLNPRSPERIPGGSSTGSAVAVARGSVDFALGTDTGGSIRIPATCCGVYGLKPSFGRVSRLGVHPRDSTLDCVGPFASNMAMIEYAMTMIDPSFRPAAPPAAISIGWVSTGASPDVAAAARAVLQQAGVTLHPVALQSFEPAFAAGLAIIGSENWAAYGHLAECESLGADVRRRLLAAAAVTPAEVAAGESVRLRLQDEIDHALADVDALALPTLPAAPPLLAEVADSSAVLRLSSLVRPFNLSGHPALSIPTSTTAGLPAGLQLVGRRNDDDVLCALGHSIAAAAG